MVVGIGPLELGCSVRSGAVYKQRGGDMKGSLFATSVLAAATVAATAAPARAAEPKFYFQIKEVTAAPDVDAGVKSAASDALKAELASRPEWASDIGGTAPGQDRGALAAELTKRKLKGFDVTVRIENFKQA